MLSKFALCLFGPKLWLFRCKNEILMWKRGNAIRLKWQFVTINIVYFFTECQWRDCLKLNTHFPNRNVYIHFSTYLILNIYRTLKENNFEGMKFLNQFNNWALFIYKRNFRKAFFSVRRRNIIIIQSSTKEIAFMFSSSILDGISLKVVKFMLRSCSNEKSWCIHTRNYLKTRSCRHDSESSVLILRYSIVWTFLKTVWVFFVTPLRTSVNERQTVVMISRKFWSVLRR